MANPLDYDVVVAGGGVAGVAAAVCAAREGASTLLLEARTFVGGNATTGLCLHNYTTRLSRQVVHGFAQEIVDRLIERGGAVGHVPYGGFVDSVTPVDGELFRIVATELLADAGVTILYATSVIGVESDGGRVTELVCAAKGTVRRVRAGSYVDASGDADLVVAAGGGSHKGHEQTGKMQPVSMLLRCFGTDNAVIAEQIAESQPAMASRPDHPEPFPVYFNGTLRRWNDELLREGIVPNADHKVFCNTVWPNHLNVNTSAVFGVDGTDPLALSRANVELTRQVSGIAAFLRERVEGFKGAYMMLAVFPGVRETRNIDGLHTLGEDDVVAGRKFADTIGQVCFPVDIHDPDTGQAEFHEIGDDGAFDIPYRSLVPTGIENVVVAGRCIAATHYAHGATRNMAPCMVTGQAAGVAAAMAADRSTPMADVDVDTLQQRLRDVGAYLGEART